MEPVQGPALAARALGKRYGRATWALQDVDLEITPGECVSLVGPNGAGKSTLLRTWIGFERPTRGQATVFGVDPHRARGRAVSQIAYVGQEAPMLGRLSSLDHLRLAAALRSPDVDWARQRLSELSIPERTPVRRLSGGQRAQVALTVALSLGAPVILLDEPLANLDPLARRQFMAEAISRAKATASTLVLASHVISDIDPDAGRIILLGRGVVALDMPTPEARRRHRVAASGELADGEVLVGTYRAHDGGERHLIRTLPAAHGPVGLEDVVLGYLSNEYAKEAA